jgi:hypothetical protein
MHNNGTLLRQHHDKILAKPEQNQAIDTKLLAGIKVAQFKRQGG